MKRFLLALDKGTTTTALVISCALLAIVSCLGLWQVLARFIFSLPSTWTEELMRRLLIWMVMLGTAVAFREGALVAVDLMLNSLKGKARQRLRAFIAFASITLLLILVVWGVDLVYRIRFQTFASMDFLTMDYAYAAVPVGALFCIIAVLAHYFDPHDTQLDNAQ